MKYFLVSGEASGDMHGANLITAIKERDKEAQFAFFGGDKMHEASGTEPINHNKNRAFMGIWEVVKNLGTIKKALKECKKSIASFSPDAVIFVDYPGFNLKIAPYCKTLGLATHYFISPKLWAWNTKRVYKLKRNIDFLYTILPFETEFYKQFNYPVDYVGNPLMDEIAKFKTEKKTDEKILALLPGSRGHEIQEMLPTMYKVA
jgi:lipid-A-disaccharide synthase